MRHQLAVKQTKRAQQRAQRAQHTQWIKGVLPLSQHEPTVGGCSSAHPARCSASCPAFPSQRTHGTMFNHPP